LKYSQAEYWHDPLKEDEYKAKSLFLSDINQEDVFLDKFLQHLFHSVSQFAIHAWFVSLKKFNGAYRENLLKIKNLVLVKFDRDEMVVPKESEVLDSDLPIDLNVFYEFAVLFVSFVI
jgi:palmitoyl-protein thioesterase